MDDEAALQVKELIGILEVVERRVDTSGEAGKQTADFVPATLGLCAQLQQVVRWEEVRGVVRCPASPLDTRRYDGTTEPPAGALKRATQSADTW